MSMLRPRSSFGSSELPTHGGAGGGSGGGSNSGSGSYGNSNSGGPYASGGANYGGYNSSSDMMMGMHDHESSSSSSTSDDKYHKKKRQFSIPPLGVMALMVANVVFVVLALLFTILWLRVSGQQHGILKSATVETNVDLQTMVSALRADLRSAQGTNSRKIEINRKYTPQINKLERENRFLQKERDELRVKHEGPDKKEEETRMKSREEAFTEQVSWMQQAIKKESKRTILERFGPGPHEVQMTFQSGKDVTPEQYYDLIFELAPIDAVPHAVHLFLEQVDHGLWNNTYFYLHGDHVLQAGPQIIRGEEAMQGTDYVRSSLKPFRAMGLDSLAFPDYSEEYPHRKWTLGFAGRPGGPDFYINLEDNTELHGPGGQYQHALEEQGDSCFGRIKTGHELIETLEKQPVISDGTDWEGFLKEPVLIVGAVVLTKNPPKTPPKRKTSNGGTLKPLEGITNNEQLGQSIVDDNPFGGMTLDDAASHDAAAPIE